MAENLSRRTHGFTLLEVLITISILVVVLSTVFVSYTGTSGIIHETQSLADTYSMARVALERMVEDLESVHVSRKALQNEEDVFSGDEASFIGTDAMLSGRDADSLQLVSTVHLGIEGYEDCGTTRIYYYVKESSQGKGLSLYRLNLPAWEEQPEYNMAGGALLCDGLHSVSYTFYDDQGDEHTNWDSSYDLVANAHPSRVSIRLMFLNEAQPDAPLSFVAGVALPAARGGYEKKTSG